MRENRNWAGAAALTAVIFVAGCSGCERPSDVIQPVAPEAITADAPNRAVRESILYVPIAIPIAEVSALVNKVVPDSLFRTREMEIQGGLLAVKLDLDIVRNGEIETYSAYGSVFNRLPIAASGRVRIPPGIWRPFETKFFLNATTDLSLGTDWKTQSTTHAAVTWEEEPYISIAGIRFGLQGPAEGAMQDALTNLLPEIDRIIEEEVNLRKEVDQVWADLAQPIQVREQPPLWLSIRPDSASYRPPQTLGDTVLVELLVEATIETVVGFEPVVDSTAELPPLRRLDDTVSIEGEYGFSVYLPVLLEFGEAATLANERLAGRTVELENGVELDLDNIVLYGRGANLVAKVDFDATLPESALQTNGTVYFTGIPVYDAPLQEVRVDSFDFDIDSRNTLTSAAEWILKQSFLEQLQRELRFPVAGHIEQGRTQLEEGLRLRRIGRHIVVLGSVETLEPGALYLVEDGIEIEVFASGRLEARVGSLEEAVKKVPRLIQ